MNKIMPLLSDLPIGATFKHTTQGRVWVKVRVQGRDSKLAYCKCETGKHHLTGQPVIRGRWVKQTAPVIPMTSIK